MFTDIVVPNGNEETFLPFAQPFGIKLVFAYPSLDSVLAAREKYKHLGCGFLLLITARESGLVLRQINAARKHGFLTLVTAGNATFNRFAAEKVPTFGIIGFERLAVAPHHHFAFRGFDYVTARTLAEKGKMVIFSFSDILSRVDDGAVLGRVAAVVSLCSKYSVPYVIASFAREPFGLRGASDLGAVLTALFPSRKKGGELTTAFGK